MDLLHFIDDENVSEIRIKKKKIISDSNSKNIRTIDIQLSVEVVYSDDSKCESEKNFMEYVDYWLNQVKKNSLKQTSLERKERTINKQLMPYFKDKKLNEVTADDVQFMVNDLTSKGLSFSTIKKALETVKEFFKFAVDRNEIIFNPALTVTLPKNIERQKSDIKFFKEDEIDKIMFESVRCYKEGRLVHRLGYIVPFLLYTGMRIGEALALKWSDIDFSKKTIFIHRSSALVKSQDDEEGRKYKIIEQSTKTKNGERTIQITGVVQECLEFMQQKNEMKSEYVFPSQKGLISSHSSVDKMFRSILRNCGLEETGVHSLRHTYASMLFKKGIDVKIISELLGHSGVDITYNTYIHLVKEQRIIEIEKI